jgi:predicted ATPase/DNA-binding SARP family transcriptional activator
LLVYRGCVEIELLGPTRVIVEGTAVSMPPKPRMLLAVLALNVNRAVSTDRLIDALWGDSPPATATKTLQTYVFQLRRMVDPGYGPGQPAAHVETDGQGYRLRIDPLAVDATRFGRLLDEARLTGSDDPRNVVYGLIEALSLWRGPALSDFAYEPFAQAEIERLEELHGSAIEDLARARLTLGEHESIVGDLRQAVIERPFHEGLWSCLMLALFRSGRRADALLAFREAEAALENELGAEPGHELQDLASRIQRDDPSLGWVPRKPDPLRTLPPRLSSFIGREPELRLARDLLGETRLLTITGPGGSGKTRLALELAMAVSATYDDVIFVDLAPVLERDHAIGTIARALGISSADPRGPLLSIGALLVGRHPLLVLDNLEQIEPIGMVVADLLPASGSAVFVVTSRVPLRIRGEQQLPIGPLRVPEAGEPVIGMEAASPAVALFVARARSVDPSFALEPGNATAVSVICRRLDGLPLAIELAAVRARALPPSAMLERLGSGLDIAGGPDLPTRQQTLRRTIEWSVALLTDDQRALFVRLGVFAGGWTLDVGAVGMDLPDPIDVLKGLIEHHLVTRVGGTTTVRFGMLETVRAFAQERLEESEVRDSIQERHRDFFVDTAVSRRETALRPGGIAALAWFVDEIDNLRAVARRLMAADDIERGLRLGTAMLTFVRLHLEFAGEVRRLLRHFLAMPRMSIEPAILANALGAAAQLALWQQDGASAAALSDEGRLIFESLGDRSAVADQLAVGGYAVRYLDPDLATTRFEAALDSYRSVGHPAEAFALVGLADVAMHGGDLGLARRRMNEIPPDLRPPFEADRASLLFPMARLYRLEGDVLAARSTYLSAIEIWRSIGAVGDLPAVLLDLAHLAMDEADPVRAIMLASYAERYLVRDTPGLGSYLGVHPIERARAVLPPEESASAAAAGARLSLDEAIAVAFAPREATTRPDQRRT